MQRYFALTRLDKPIGIWLVFFPAAWGALLAPQPASWGVLAVLLAGAVITRSAGCILNDIIDRKLDAQVERTKNRPLANGSVKLPEAVLLLALLGVLALYLALQLPRSVFAVVPLAVPMIALYPLMKRITWWPQLFLGLTFNLGALMGWLATGAGLTAGTWFLYGACVWWTLGYDTIYAVQDMRDDETVGIKSTARRVGTRLRAFVAGCYLAMLGLLLMAGLLADGPPFYYAGLAAASAHALWQVHILRNLSPEQAGMVFRSNQYLGLLILLPLLLGRFAP